MLGITGTGGAGKSSLVDELVRRFLAETTDKTIAVLSVDPSKRKTGGALLGDRIRMNAIDDPRVYMRSLATRQSNLSLSKHVGESIEICRAAGFDLIIVETSGIGQSDTEITEFADVALYIMTAEYGAATQLEKIDMLDFADNRGHQQVRQAGLARRSARREEAVAAQPQRLHRRRRGAAGLRDHRLAVQRPGMNRLYTEVMRVVARKTGAALQPAAALTAGMSEKRWIIPPERTRYLAEIVETCEAYDAEVRAQRTWRGACTSCRAASPPCANASARSASTSSSRRVPATR